MARPKGTTRSVQIDRKVVARMDELKAFVADDVVDAYHTITHIMRDTTASATARKGAAENIIKLHNVFYKDICGDGASDISDEETNTTVKKIGKVLSLKFGEG